MTKILYVEDNEDNIYVLSRRLARRGYEVIVARDGRSGLEQARAGQPDLIIMDLILPEIDGWEATRRLKADPDTAGIPVIGLSASAMAEDRQRALDAGCDEFDAKPVDLARLLNKINAVLAGGAG